MKERSDKNNQTQEPGEAQLNKLIKQAGQQARSRKKKVLAQHIKMLQAAVDEGVARRKKSFDI